MTTKKAAIALLKGEIAWVKQHKIHPSRAFTEGFLEGLHQAIYIVSALRETPKK